MLILPIGMRNQDEPFLINEHDRLILGEEEPAGLPALLLVVIRLHWMWLIRPELQLLPQYHSDLEPRHVQLSGYYRPWFSWTNSWLYQYQSGRHKRASSWFLGPWLAMGMEKPLYNPLERVVCWILLGVELIFLPKIMSNLCHRFSFCPLNNNPGLLLLLNWAVTPSGRLTRSYLK